MKVVFKSSTEGWYEWSESIRISYIIGFEIFLDFIRSTVLVLLVLRMRRGVRRAVRLVPLALGL